MTVEPVGARVANVDEGQAARTLVRHPHGGHHGGSHSLALRVVVRLFDDATVRFPDRLTQLIQRIDPDVQLDLWETTVEPGQRILLCSDGLVDEVDEPTIESILRVETEAESAADRLVELANEHGGRDNISLVIFGDPAPNGDLLPPTEEIAIPIEKPSNIDAGTPSTRRIGHRAARVVLATATALALTVMLVLALIWVRSGFVVTFDDDQVVVLRGREVLWFEPTQVAVGPYERNELDRVSQDLVRQAPRFDRLEDAETFVAERLVRDQTFAQDAGIDT